MISPLPSEKEIPLWLAVLPILLTVTLLALQLLVFHSFDPQAPLLFGIFFSAVVGLARGWKWQDMEKGMFNIIVISLPAIAILLLIGILIGAWVASGTVPYMVYHGLQLLTPEFFLFSGFVLCSIMSLALGTSWGTIGTLGIVIVGIGQTMGFPLWLSTAAVVSGAFFGDKMSPISDTTNLAPAITGTKVYDHVRNMVPTTVPAMMVGMIVYLIIGFYYQVPEMDHSKVNELLKVIDANFELNILTLLPPLIIIILALSGVSAIPAMFGGVLAGLLVAGFVQGHSMGELFEIIRTGYHNNTGIAAADNIFNRGGIVSMSDTMSIVFFALTFGGILERIGVFDTILRHLLKRISKFWQLQVSAISGTVMMILGTGDSYLPMAFIGRLFSKAYDKFGYSRLNLSRAIEEGGTLMTPLVPWSASGIFVSTTLGLGISEGNIENLLYIPLAIGCWLSPLLGIIFPVMGWFSKKATLEEIKSYSTIDSSSSKISQPFKSFLKWYNPPVNAYVSTPEIALDNNISDAAIPLKEVFEHGDMGFGHSAESLVLVIDGDAYLVGQEMNLTRINIETKLHAVNLTHFSKDYGENLKDENGFDLSKIIPAVLPSLNMIYGFSAEAVFKSITLAEKSYRKEFRNIRGRVFGFYYPSFMKNIASGLKLFFIDENHSIGGIIDSSIASEINLEIGQIPKLNAGLPVTVDFLTADLDT